MIPVSEAGTAPRLMGTQQKVREAALRASWSRAWDQGIPKNSWGAGF